MVTEMSKRTHFWLRLAAVVVIAASAWVPRGITTVHGVSAQGGEARAIHASIAR
jgi:hypothetical protein